jgi:hypothetical protein
MSFLPGGLEGELSDLGEGETGGAASFWHLDCSACRARVRRLRVDKVFEAIEDWAIERPPTNANGSGGWVCPYCAGAVGAAIPPDAQIREPWGLGEGAARLTLRVEAVCSCSAQFERVVNSRFDPSGGRVDSDETWYSVVLKGHTRVARPLATPLKVISGA